MMRVINTVTVLLLVGRGLAAASVEDGVNAFVAGRYSEALQQLSAASPSDERARLYLALTQAAMNRCDAALPILATELQSQDAEHGRLAGLAATRCFAASDNMSEALNIIEKLKKRFPANADVLYLAAETEMKAFNQTSFQMFQLAPSSYRVHELSARIFEIENRFSDAIAEYKKAIEQNPQAPDLHYRLGRALLMDSHSPETLELAAAAFRNELKVSPEDAACEFQLGQIAQVRSEDSAAEQHFERALQFSPKFVSAMIALANLYSRGKQYERAIPLLRQSVALQPDNEAAHYALMTAYRNAGQLDDARAEKVVLERLQRSPDGEFTEFLKKLGDRPPQQ